MANVTATPAMNPAAAASHTAGTSYCVIWERISVIKNSSGVGWISFNKIQRMAVYGKLSM